MGRGGGVGTEPRKSLGNITSVSIAHIGGYIGHLTSHFFR